MLVLTSFRVWCGDESIVVGELFKVLEVVRFEDCTTGFATFLLVQIYGLTTVVVAFNLSGLYVEFLFANTGMYCTFRCQIVVLIVT